MNNRFDLAQGLEKQALEKPKSRPYLP